MPLTVSFRDTSIGTPTSWSWDFNNDGIVDSHVQNPTHTYTDPGTYSIKFIASNADWKDSVIKGNCITINNATEIKTIDNFDVTIYPNPTSGIITIDLSKEAIRSASTAIEVFDTNGKSISFNKEINGNNLRIDFSGFSQGIYFLKISGKDKTFTKKIFIR